MHRRGAADIDLRLAGRLRYQEVAPGVWQSDRWREPRIEAEAVPQGHQVRGTDLEA